MQAKSALQLEIDRCMNAALQSALQACRLCAAQHLVACSPTAKDSLSQDITKLGILYLFRRQQFRIARNSPSVCMEGVTHPARAEPPLTKLLIRSVRISARRYSEITASLTA